jgi:DNA-binding MarR family transcriptional regulator
MQLQPSSTMFNPHYNAFNTASKIVIALERISEAFRVMLWQESKANGLSPLQIQIVIFLAFHPALHCKVSYLAQEFNMTKPTISDAVRVLEEKKLITKEQSESDTRSYSMHLTEQGQVLAQRASSFARKFDTPLTQMPPIEQEALLGQLLSIINSLHKEGILTTRRACSTCAFFAQNPMNATSYCIFLKQTLLASDIRVDCPHHEMAV